MVETFGTGKRSDNEIEEIILKSFRLTPKGIIETLNLKQPIYAQTAAYGHFGRTDIDLAWERVDAKLVRK